MFDGIAATPGTFTLDALPASNITDIKGLQGKTVGVSSLNDPTALALQAELVRQQRAAQLGALRDGAVRRRAAGPEGPSVDATVDTEPYKTQNAQAIGARTVVDIFGDASGFANFPIAA